MAAGGAVGAVLMDWLSCMDFDVSARGTTL
jgi:hypothetical protein